MSGRLLKYTKYMIIELEFNYVLILNLLYLMFLTAAIVFSLCSFNTCMCTLIKCFFAIVYVCFIMISKL